MELPESYKKRMQSLLGGEYPAYLASLDEPRLYGLRVNTSKISVEEFERIAPFPIRRIPYVPNGFFYDGETVQPAKHPYYFAGLYYLQDPSAMTPASRLPIEPGNRVLDLCAAPGGKSTELAARLVAGLLVANDISASRAKALQKNIELFGITNSLITTEYPEKLTQYFPQFFDRVLIDAPCSGEGMFRKDPAMVRSWSEDSPQKYAAMQEDIVRHALPMLAPGGYLLYSTCTFSPLEDEGTVKKILAMDPSLSLVPMEGYEGFATGFDNWDEYRRACGETSDEISMEQDGEALSMKNCVRIFPHRMEGEGHFLALFKKADDDLLVSDGAYGNTKQNSSRMSKDERSLWESFASGLSREFCEDRIESHDGKLFLNVPGLPQVRGLRFLRNGLYLGECKKNRFEPSQALAMTLRMDEYKNVLNLPADDERVVRYLKGETIRVEEPGKSGSINHTSASGQISSPESVSKACELHDGLILICVDGYPLGWGKKTGATIKNKYHSGWRMM
ncbi:MAG: RsmB/NOP family class I SAM-dependent RNA methyltransferase [Eubacterium sp.]|nr:RsmB/NOP family class I SAM-dependent RNA methyltransferase [Eubacterium sp.]